MFKTGESYYQYQYYVYFYFLKLAVFFQVDRLPYKGSHINANFRHFAAVIIYERISYTMYVQCTLYIVGMPYILGTDIAIAHCKNSGLPGAKVLFVHIWERQLFVIIISKTSLYFRRSVFSSTVSSMVLPHI